MEYVEFSTLVTLIVAIGGGFTGIYLLLKTLGLLKPNGNGTKVQEGIGYLSTRCPFYGTELIALVQTNEKVVSALEQQNKRLDGLMVHTEQISVINERLSTIQRKLEHLD